MNEKEFLQKIKEIKVIVPDEQFFLEYNSVVYSILKENQKLKEKLEASEKARKNCYEYLKNPPEDVWSGHSLEKAKELLDTDKGEMKDE